MERLLHRVRPAVDFVVLLVAPILLVVGISDVFGGDTEAGVVEIAIVLIAALTARSSLSRAREVAAGKTREVRPSEALLAFVLFAFVGTLSVTNAVRSEGARAVTDALGAVFLFALAGLALWVSWRARSRQT